MESPIQIAAKETYHKDLKVSPRSIVALSPKIQWGGYWAALVLSDLFLSLAALLLAEWIRLHVPLPFFNLGATPTIPSTKVVIFGFVPMWLLVFTLHGLYRPQILLGGTQEYARVFRATAIGILVIIVFGFINPELSPARGYAVLAWLFIASLVMLGRFFLRRGVYALRQRGFFLSPALIIGDNPEGLSLAQQLTNWRTSGFAIQGVVSVGCKEALVTEEGLPILGTLEQLDELVRRFQIGELILATSALSQEQILSVFKKYGVSDTINLRLSSGLFEVITTGMEVKEVASVPLLQINQVRLTGLDYVFKSGLDLVLGALVLLISLPFLGLIALAIRLDSPGAVIYRRRVMGLNGSQFDAFKFRTMFINGDEIMNAHPEMRAELEESFKVKQDPRVTNVGRFLRKYSLDELPQLFNVMLRQMSLVGPRMISPDELVKYEQWDINLLTIPPGMTGLWQVSGRSDLSYNDRVQLDMRYIRNWSFWLDLHILMRTFFVVVKGSGAY